MIGAAEQDAMHGTFEELVRAHHQAVWRSAWRVVRDAADADDVTQEVFLHALRRPGELARARDPEHVLRWLAVRSALARLRGDRNRRRREEGEAMLRREPIESEPPERREALATVRREVEGLPEPLRLATVLRFQEGLSFAQVGECLGIAEPTAFERVKKALEQLRARLAGLGQAGAVAQLEGLLAVPESVAAPAALAGKLLALGASGAAAVTTGAMATGAMATGTVTTGAAASGAAASGAGGKLAAAALAIVVIGGGALLATRPWRETEPVAPASAAVARSSEREEPITNEPAAADPARSAPTRTTEPIPASEAALRPSDDERARSHGRIEGSLADETGRPVAGAQVEASGHVAGRKGFRAHANATSDEHGAFALDLPIHVEGEQPFRLEVRHADFVPHRSELREVGAEQPLDLGTIAIQRNTADRAGDFTLEVGVVDAAGAPVKGALVRLERRLATTPETFEIEAGGVTNETGALRLSGSRIGAKRITILARRLGFQSLRELLEIEWTGFQERTFTLQEGLVLAGRLVFPDGADVRRETLGENVPLSEIGGERGAIRLHLPTGGGTVHVGGAQVYALADDPGADRSDWLHAELAEDGSFRIVGLDPGTYTLHVRSDFSPAALDEVAAGREDLEIVLKRRDDLRDVGSHLGEIHGRLIDAATGAATIAHSDAVECELVRAEDSGSLAEDFLPTVAGPSVAPRQVAFAPGYVPPPPSDAFHLTGLDAGAYVVVARVPGYAPAFSAPLEVARHGLVKDVLLRLERPATARGRVLDDEGRPIAGAVVLALGDGPRSKQLLDALDESVRAAGERGVFMSGVARTDAKGRFELAGLSPSLAVVLTAVHAKFLPARDDLRTFVGGSPEVTLRTSPRP